MKRRISQAFSNACSVIWGKLTHLEMENVEKVLINRKEVDIKEG